MSTHRVFRYLWRANAILIFVATGIACLAATSVLLSEVGCNARRRRAAEAAPAVIADPKERLYLGPLKRVEGTDVLRAELLAARHGLGVSSGGYGTDTRNILYFDSDSNTARWLLPDSSRVISDETVLWSDVDDESKTRRQLAVVVLVKMKADDSELGTGVLRIMDPEARRTRDISEGVRAVSHASMSGDNSITLIFERNRKYVRTIIDGRSFEPKSEVEVAVPELE
jgi:hypothetical protein